MREDQAKAIFLLSGIELFSLVPVANPYSGYSHLFNGPWWNCQTDIGPVTIGWRKRVISIDWEQGPLRYIVTEDSVTKDDRMVHAWHYYKAVEYLHNLKSFSRGSTGQDQLLNWVREGNR